MKEIFFFIFILLRLMVLKTLTPLLWSQGLVEEFRAPIVAAEGSSVFTENIKIISRNQRIFILTNTNSSLIKGDFITLGITEYDFFARALVAKNHDGLVGIKILKILSLKNWRQVKKDMNVFIIKGDLCAECLRRSKKPEKSETTQGPTSTIQGEEDLYNLSEGGIDGNFDKSNRLIKPDNIVALGYSQSTFQNTLTNETRALQQFWFNWNYQILDDIWLEGVYGRTLLDDFPAEAAQTLINNFTIRAKYTLELPLYSYAMPYVGYQFNIVSSPDAGIDPLTRNEELQLIETLQSRQLIFGVTILRRLVPGWFLKIDLGTDLIGAGFGVEF